MSCYKPWNQWIPLIPGAKQVLKVERWKSLRKKRLVILQHHLMFPFRQNQPDFLKNMDGFQYQDVFNVFYRTGGYFTPCFGDAGSKP